MRPTQMVPALQCVHVLCVLARQSADSGSNPKTNMMYSPRTDPLLQSTPNRQIKNIWEAREASKRGLPLGRTGY